MPGTKGSSQPLYGIEARADYLTYAIKTQEAVARARLLELEKSNFEKIARRGLQTQSFGSYVEQQERLIGAANSELTLALRRIEEKGDAYVEDPRSPKRISWSDEDEASCRVPVLAPEIQTIILDLVFDPASPVELHILDVHPTLIQPGEPSSRDGASRDLASKKLGRLLNHPGGKSYVCGLQDKGAFPRHRRSIKFLYEFEDAYRGNDRRPDRPDQISRWLQNLPDRQPTARERRKQKAREMREYLYKAFEEYKEIESDDGGDDRTLERDESTELSPWTQSMQTLCPHLCQYIQWQLAEAQRKSGQENVAPSRALPAPTDSEAESSTRPSSKAVVTLRQGSALVRSRASGKKREDSRDADSGPERRGSEAESSTIPSSRAFITLRQGSALVRSRASGKKREDSRDAESDSERHGRR